MHNDMFGPNKINSQEAAAAIDQVERIITISNYVGQRIASMFPQAAPSYVRFTPVLIFRDMHLGVNHRQHDKFVKIFGRSTI